MKEKHIQTLLGKHIKENPPEITTVYELKLCKGNAVPFNSVKPHQIEALVNATSSGIYWKLPDMAAKSGFSHPKPFDCLIVKRAKAFVVVCFYEPRKKKELMFINVFEWNRIKGVLDRKSLPIDVAREIAEEVVHL
jgi:penicillin-binding protein-related factor A (putative recombinase)